MISVGEAFLRVEAALQPLLDTGEFPHVASRQDTDAFGSRFAVYESDRSGLRLTWDGKEPFFVLESDRLPNETTAGPWIDLTLQRFDPRKADDQWVEELCEDISAALREYMEQWTA